MEYHVGSVADMISESPSKKTPKKKIGTPKVKFEKITAKEVPTTKNISKKNKKSEDESPIKRARFSEPLEIDSPVNKSENTDQDKNKDLEKGKYKVNNQEEQQRTIFVGNLKKTSTKYTMRRLFAQYGFIEAIRFRSVSVADPRMSKKVAHIKQQLHPDRSNVNAYIRFKDIESAQKALAENGNVVNGHTLRVDMALGVDQYNAKACVFVGNLKFLIHEDDLRKAFEDCGKILNVRIVRDKATGMGRGIAFIEFENSQSVELALKLDNEDLMGRKIRVSRLKGKGKASGPEKGRWKLGAGKRLPEKMKQLKHNSPQGNANGINTKTGSKTKKAANQQNKSIISVFQGEKTDQKKAKKKKKMNKGELKKKVMQSQLGIAPKPKKSKPAKQI